MALNSKKPAFGFSLEETLNRGPQNVDAGTPTHTDADTHTHTHTHTDAHAHTHVYPDIKENKTKRLHLLTKPSVHGKLEAYAKANGDTLNNLVNRLMEEFIEENGL